LPKGRLHIVPEARSELETLLKEVQEPVLLSRKIAGLTRPVAELALACQAPGDFLMGLLSPPVEDIPPSHQLLTGGARPLPLSGNLPKTWPESYSSNHFDTLDALTRASFLETAQEDRRERSRKECHRAIRSLVERLQRQLAKNRLGQEECARAPELRELGELLKVNLKKVPRGATSITLVDYQSGEPQERTLPLSPRKSAMANMDHFFSRAKRLTLKLPMLERKARHLEAELRQAEELAERLQLPDLDPLLFKEELRALAVLNPRPNKSSRSGKSAKGKGKKKRKEKKRELRTFVSSDGLRILVGRSNEENDYLVRRAGKKGDSWLHAEGATGAHVLVKLSGRMQRPPARTLEEAAQLAAHFSHSRYETKARVMLSAIGVVKKAPGAAPGQVLVPKFETLVVRPDPGIIRRLSPLGSGRTSR
jgi:predicted ribosome quality control (RQC) complex YloA/Tae2 family protein